MAVSVILSILAVARRHRGDSPMTYCVTPLPVRPWTLNGISPRLIESHYELNYGGAVARLNAVQRQLAALDRGKAAADAVLRLKREEAEALNATLLHEIYFASLGGDGRAVPPKMAAALARDFGAVNRWRDEFIGLAEALAAARSAGWALLSVVPRDGRLVNHVAADDGQALAGGIPVLALDLYEHAYHLDFGANAVAYVAAFMRNIAWTEVEARTLDALQAPPPRRFEQPEFAATPSVGPDEVEALLKSGQRVQLIDARPRHYVARATDIVDGAVWRDPERIEEWIGALDKEAPVVTFCVYGFHIGCQTAAALREKGFDAKYMRGGHYAWKAGKGAMRRFEA
jgi:superoxide dismutase, Fe-Mn family